MGSTRLCAIMDVELAVEGEDSVGSEGRGVVDEEARVDIVAVGGSIVIAVIAALVRVFERPHHATALCAGAWLALVGAVAILLGAWQSLRDERTSLYGPVSPPADTQLLPIQLVRRRRRLGE